MSSKFDETINQFHVGDFVKEKGKTQIMKITSNMPGGGMSAGHYLKTDKFKCEWADKDGNPKVGIFEGANLEVV